jgi:predicted small secreted protein
MKKLALAALLAASATVAACNTMKGVGEDVEAAGRGIGAAAEEVKEDIQNSN